MVGLFSSSGLFSVWPFFPKVINLVKSKIWPFLKQSLAFFSCNLLATLPRAPVIFRCRRDAEVHRPRPGHVPHHGGGGGRGQPGPGGSEGPRRRAEVPAAPQGAQHHPAGAVLPVPAQRPLLRLEGPCAGGEGCATIQSWARSVFLIFFNNKK